MAHQKPNLQIKGLCLTPHLTNKIAKFLFAFACLVSVSLNTQAEEEFDAESVKAGFIGHFIDFTRWPKGSAISNNEFFTICIAGEDPYSKILKHFRKKAHGRPIQFKQLSPEIVQDGSDELAQLNRCHVLLLLLDDISENTFLLDKASQFPVLTISEIQNRHRQKSMINMFPKNGGIAFSVNRNSARETGIDFSSQLLRHAESVIGGGK